MTIASDDIILAEIDVNVAGTETTVRATGDSVQRTGASDVFYPTLKSPFVGLARSMFPPNTTRGESPQSVGEAELLNPEGFYDGILAGAFAGRRFVARRGQVSALATYPDAGWTTVLDGVMSVPDITPTTREPGSGSLRLQVRDARKWLSVPFETDTYAGDNSGGNGIEGTADDLKGKRKPNQLGGASFNVPLVLVNAEKNIWQAHNGELHAFDEIRDDGFPLTSSGVIFEPNTTPKTNASDTIWGVAFGAGVWVAVGYNAASNAPICMTSPDGVTWTARTLTGFGATDQALCVAFGNGLFVVGGGTAGGGVGAARISTSTDGITWTSRTPSGFTGGNVRAVAYSTDAALWVAVGSAGQIGSSTNGTAWTSRTSGTGAALASVAVGRGVFVVAALDSGIITSRDAITWTARTTQFANAGFLTIAYTTLGFFAAGYNLTSGNPGANTAAFSEDGLTWELRDSFTGTTSASLGIAEDDGRVFAIAAQSLWSTVDGDTWVERANAFSDSIGGTASSFAYTIAAGNGSLLVGGNTSVDGAVAWTTIPAVVYADTTELEDDDLAPPAGSYITCPSAGYVRIGGTSQFVGQITADLVQGATIADRTHAQLIVQCFERAGLSVSPNLVTNPSTITLGAGWTINGTATGTAAAVSRAGFSFSRLAGINGGDAARIVGLTGNTKKTCSWLIISNGATGFSHIGLVDNNAATWLLRLAYTIDASGVVTAAAEVGTLLSVRNLGHGMFLVTGRSTTVNAAHTNVVYANGVSGNASSTLTSVLMSDAYVSDNEEEGDWLRADIVMLDEAQSGAAEMWISPDETPTCGDVANKIARSCGASIFADQYGVLRVERLEPAATNLVASPSDLATSPWANAGGTVSAANGASVVNGRSYSRLTNTNNGFWAQTLSLVEDGVYDLTFYIKRDASNGTLQTVWSDNTAVANRVNVVATIAANGTITLSVANGTLVRFVALNGGLGDYAVVIRATGVVAANSNQLIASYGPGSSATNVLLSEFFVVAAAPTISVDQNDCAFSPMRSGEENDGTPPHRVTVQYRKNYAVQTNGLAADTSESLKPQLAREFREAISDDAAILTRHPTSRPIVLDSCFVEEADAQDEADRVLSFLGDEPRWWQAVVQITTDTQDGAALTANAQTLATLELNDIYEQVHSRYGLGAGRRLRVMELQPRTEGLVSTITATLWG
jgi:hypothetical protein